MLLPFVILLAADSNLVQTLPPKACASQTCPTTESWLWESCHHVWISQAVNLTVIHKSSLSLVLPNPVITKSSPFGHENCLPSLVPLFSSPLTLTQPKSGVSPCVDYGIRFPLSWHSPSTLQPAFFSLRITELIRSLTWWKITTGPWLPEEYNPNSLPEDTNETQTWSQPTSSVSLLPAPSHQQKP